MSRTGYLIFLATTLYASVPALAQDAAVERLKSYRFGGDASVIQAVTQRVDEARGNPSVRAQVARALADVLQSDASFDAKQFACRQLVFIGSEQQIPALASLLKDERLAHYGVMALARIPGSAASAALRGALPSLRGGARAEVMDALGERRDAASVRQIERSLLNADAVEASAAASALAKIANAPAVNALKAAYGRSSGAAKTVLGDALLAGARRLPLPADSRLAISVFTLLSQANADPVLRAGALRGLTAVEGPRALPQILKALAEDGSPRQAAAADLIRTLESPNLSDQLTATLPTLSPRGRVMLLSALAHPRFRGAASVVSRLTKDSDPSVRLAAVGALGAIGDDEAVPVLIDAAAAGNQEMRDAAQRSLSLLPGMLADRRLAVLAGSGPVSARIQAVEAIGRRQSGLGMDMVLRAAQSKETALSAAALRVLRDQGSVSLLPQLLDLLLTTPAGERADIAEAAGGIARRAAGEQQRTGELLARLEKSQVAADRIDILGILRVVGGPNALSALRSAAGSSEQEVRVGAIRQLAEWPSDEPMGDLLNALKATQDRRERTLALRGYIRMIGLNEGRSPTENLRLYREAASFATTTDEKRMILGGIGKVRSLGALELAAGYLKDDELRAEAELAVVEAARATAGAYPQPTRAALEPIAKDSSNEDSRNRARALLDLMNQYADFVTAWEVSPAYQSAGVGYGQLFEMPFAPEEPGKQEQVAWSLMPAGTKEQPWLLDLLALYPSEQRVAYLRTSVWSESAREAILEMGSDDGIKVWLNGAVVHSNNTARAAAPGQDRIKVSLKPGRNDLLVKVTQNVLGWGACARFTSVDGSPTAGIRFAIASEK